MDFSLTAEQRAIQALAREVAEAEIAPHAAAWDRDHTFPREVFAKLGELGLHGRLCPRGARRRRGGLPLVHPRARGAVAGRCRCRRHRRGAHERGDAPDRRVRHRRAAAAVRAGARGRSRARRLRAHRGRFRVGCGCPPVVGRAGRRRLEDQRREAVDHERQPRRHVPRLRAHRPDDGRLPRGQCLPARRRRRRGDAGGGEARPQLVVDGGHSLRGRVRGPGSAAPRGESRLHGRDGDARRRADRHRRAGRRDRAGRLRRGARATRSSAASSAAGSPTSRRSSSSSPTWRPRSRPPAGSPTARRG